MLVSTSVRQFLSAQCMVTNVGMRHGEWWLGRLVVGVSAPDPHDGLGQLVHFCPADLYDCQRLSDGDGKRIPISEDYRVVIQADLPLVPTDGFLDLLVMIHANGALTFKPFGKRAIFVPSPPRIANDAPFADPKGLTASIEEYGQRTVKQVVARYGQTLQLQA